MSSSLLLLDATKKRKMRDLEPTDATDQELTAEQFLNIHLTLTERLDL